MDRGVTVQRIETAVALVEEAVFLPETLPAALERVSETIDASMFHLLRTGGERAPDFIGGAATTAAALAYEKEGWWQIDDRTLRLPTIAQAQRRLMRDQDAFAVDFLRRSQIYNEWFRDEGLDWCTGWSMSLAGETWSWSLLRSAKVGPVSDLELKLLTAAAPAFNRAAMLMLHLREGQARGVLAGLEAIAKPAVALDHLGDCTMISPSAKSLFDASFGLRGGRLWAADQRSQAGLAALASIASRRLIQPVAPSVPIFRSDGRRPILAFPLPVRGLGRDVLPGARLVLMLVDLESQPRPPEDALRAAFQLTPTETIVVQHMAAGLSLETIAGLMGLTIATVRHMTKAIFSKTGVHRQSELAALLAKLPSPIRRPGG